MPTILNKQDVLDGRAQVFNYKRNAEHWYYREVVPGEQRYRTKRIPNVTTQSEAVGVALQIFSEFRETPVEPVIEQEKITKPLLPHRSIDLANANVDTGGAHTLKRKPPSSAFKNRKKKGRDIGEVIDDYLTIQAERVEAALIKEGTFKETVQTLGVHLKGYFNEKGIASTNQIKEDSFKGYPTYRKWCTKLTRNKEAGIIKAFVDNHLTRQRLIAPEVAMIKNLVPKVKIKQSDLDANPAINAKDWSIINKWIRFEYVTQGKQHPRPSVYYWRYLFWTFTIVMKNTGCRPAELLNLRWKDVEIEDVGRISRSKLEEEIQELEAEGIDIVGDHEGDPGDWAPSENSLGREERLIAYLFIKTSKTGDQREVPANIGQALRRFYKFQEEYIALNKCPGQLTPNTFVFANPEKGYIPYGYSTFSSSWWRMMRALDGQLQGHKFSDRPYTIYSMRSTFIEDMLLKQMDIFLLSRICGHSVDMLVKHYERLDIKERAKEVSDINYGARERDRILIDLFDKSEEE